MTSAGRVGSILVLLAALHAVAAHAQDAAAAATTPQEDLMAIREMILYARYTTAEPAIAALLARTDLSAAERNAGLESRAMVLIARRRLPEARAVLAELYSRDPEHTIRDPDAGPEVRNAFDRARADHPAPITITMEDATEATMATRGSPTVEIHVTAGADAVDELRLWYRNGPEGAFQQTIMTLDRATSSARARIPLADGREAYEASYYADATAPSGATLAVLGSPESPLTVSVPAAETLVAAAPTDAIFAGGTGPVDAPHQASVVEEWWFWTLIGVVVVGAGVGIGFGVNAATTPSGPMPGTLGEGRL